MLFASPKFQLAASLPSVQVPTDTLQTVVVGPLEFQFDGNKQSSVLLMLLAVALYAPNLLSWIAGKVRKNSTSEKSSVNTLTSEVATSNMLNLNQHFNLPVTDTNRGVDADSYNEGVLLGSRYVFLTVAHQLIGKIRTDALSLVAGFTEEEHATKYRKSKLNRVTEFCSTLDSALEEQWFLQACVLYKGSFSEKQVTLATHLRNLTNLKKDLFSLSGRFDRDPSAKATAAEYEEKFKLIYVRLIDELHSLCDALLTLNTRCAAEFSQPAATQALYDASSKIAARRNV
jgi:hypothetical protein